MQHFGMKNDKDIFRGIILTFMRVVIIAVTAVLWGFDFGLKHNSINNRLNGTLQFVTQNIPTISLCLFLLWLCYQFFMNWGDLIVHIIQGNFTGTGAIIWLSQWQWSNPKLYE